MRSRYAAFALGLGEYLVKTLASTHPDRALPPHELARDLSRAPLTGNQKKAEVCVVLKNRPTYAKVTLGAKAASACVDEYAKVKCKKDHQNGDGCPPTVPKIPLPL